MRTAEVPFVVEAKTAQLVVQLTHASMKSSREEVKEIDVGKLTNYQAKVHNILSSKWAERVLGFSFLINGVTVILETDAHARNEHPAWWVERINLLLLVAYTMELAARLWVLRVDFFNSVFNILDLIVILADLIILAIQNIVGSVPSVSLLRVLRLVKILRSRDILVKFPEMHQMMKSLLKAASTILWGGVTIFITLTIWSIIAVEFVHPLNLTLAQKGVYDSVCDRCPRAFSTVMDANLTFMQQLIAGDGWGTICIPLIENYPYLIFYFAGVLMTVSLGIMNLITAIIVDRAAEARQDSLRVLAERKEKDFMVAAKDLVKLCQGLDQDGNGTISKNELLSGFDNSQEFADTLRVMDVRREDMETVFNIMDEDGSGDIDYTEFAEQLHKMKSHDAHTLLVFIKFYVTEIRRKLSEQIKLLEDEIRHDFDLMTTSLDKTTAQAKDMDYHEPINFSPPEEPMPVVVPNHDENSPPISSLTAGKKMRRSIQQGLQGEFEQLRYCINQGLSDLRVSNEETTQVMKELLLGDKRWQRRSGTPHHASGNVPLGIPNSGRNPFAFQNCCSNFQHARGSVETVSQSPCSGA